MSHPDLHNLQRFVDAQAPVVDRVRKELSEGRKRTHWMWFVFPQLKGLGASPMAQQYGIASLAEAKAYVVHPVLGPRIVEHTELVVAVPEKSAHDIFGWPDDLKFRSSMTLFAHTRTHRVFQTSLERFFGSVGDEVTLERLSRDSS